jgi:Na+-driven multidrug efflux pump
VIRLRSEWDRDILRLAVPAFGALVAEPLYVLADTAIVGTSAPRSWPASRCRPRS